MSVPEVGQVLAGKYRVERVLGQGGPEVAVDGPDVYVAAGQGLSRWVVFTDPGTDTWTKVTSCGATGVKSAETFDTFELAQRMVTWLTSTTAWPLRLASPTASKDGIARFNPPRSARITARSTSVEIFSVTH